MFDLPSVDDLDRALRKYKIKASDLGRRAGVDKSIVSKILNHKYNPSYETMTRLFGALGQMIAGSPERISDAMVRDVVTAASSDSLASVVAKMKKGGFSQIPVLAEGKFVGLVTEHSLLVRDKNASRAEDVLGVDFAVVDPDEPLESARQVLLGCQAIVAVQNGVLRGIMTKADLIK